MSMIPTTHFPRSMFDMDYWMRPSMDMGPSTLDVFDPFDELDRMMGRNMQWVNTPSILEEMRQMVPKVPKKWRCQMDVKGFNPKSIKCSVSDDHKKLIVSAQEGDASKKGGDNYTIREMKRTFDLPKHAETDKLVSFVTPNGKLIVEVPQKSDTTKPHDDLMPRIVEGEKGMKNVHLNVHLPESIDPSKVKVTCKDRDLIVQAEDRKETQDSSSQLFFYRRSTMPEMTDFKNLKCVMDKNHNLSITAPVSSEMRTSDRTIPVEMKKSIQ